MRQEPAPEPRVIGVAEAGTLPGLFKLRAEWTPAATAYIHWSNGAWRQVSWREAYEATLRWRAALLEEDLEPGDRVAILLPNRLEWICLEQAALALGLVVVPLYNWDSPGNIVHILADCGARLLLLESMERAAELASELAGLESLQRIIAISAESADASGCSVLLEAWLAAGRQDSDVDPGPLDPDDLATLIYTSGTTSLPKGVMLSHRNILSNAAAILDGLPPRPGDRFLSVLPLAHAYERTVGYYVPMMAGLPTAYARSPQTVSKDMITHRPTIMLVVPRLLERVHARINQGLARKGPLARWLFALALAAGWRRFLASQGHRPGIWARLAWPLLKSLVVKPLMARLGGRLRMMVSGGAPLSPEISRMFLSLGISVIQGYGMSETSPVIATNLVEDNHPDSVGPPLKGCQIAIGEQDELLVRSPGVMLGYWNKPEKTREVIDSDGWLHTGDCAEIRDGRVYIKGRLGEVVKLSTGHKIPLAAVESGILRDPLFGQAMALAQGRHDVMAIAVLDPDEWQDLAKSFGIDPSEAASLDDGRVTRAALDRMARQLADLPPYCRPRHVVLDLEPWSIESGLLTPTLKVKRRAVLAHYADRIGDATGC